MNGLNNYLLNILVVVVFISTAVVDDGDAQVVRYNVTFTTHWSEELFPKQYPLYRPNAQWSRLIGRVHAPEFLLFRAGKLSTPAVRIFSETGSAEELAKHIQGKHGVYDVFNTENIPTGEGKTWATFFADRNHSRFSAMSKLIPSPDWFVGVDSIDLHPDGEWLERAELSLRMYDAGTDKGYTFSSPNWEERPPAVICEITSLKPDHPANSFYYPDLASLPTIASMTIIKIEDNSCLSEHEETEVDDSDVEATDAPEKPEMGTTIDGANLENSASSTQAHFRSTAVPLSSKQPRRSSVQSKFSSTTSDSHHSSSMKSNDEDVDVDENDAGQDEVENTIIPTTSHPRTTTSLSASTRVATRYTTKQTIRPTTAKPILQRYATKRNAFSTVQPTEKTSVSTTTIQKPTYEPITVKHRSKISSHHQRIETLRRRHEERQNQQDGAHFRLLSRRFTDEPIRDEKQFGVGLRQSEEEQVSDGEDMDLLHLEEAAPVKLVTTPAASLDVAKADDNLDCIIGWSAWSACSKSCGYGDQQRTYGILRQTREGGRPCPSRVRTDIDRRLCGSMRNCEWAHFSFSNWGDN